MRIENNELLNVFRSKTVCEWCNCRCGPVPHHWRHKGIGGGAKLDVPWNLISLCWKCHAMLHDGNLTGKSRKADNAALMKIIAKRECRTPEWCVAALDLLARLDKWSDWRAELETLAA